MKINIPKNNVIVDIETLGIRPGSVILSIGAVELVPESGGDLGREFYTEISRSSSIMAGLSTDDDTVKWWREQSPEARRVFDREVHTTLQHACEGFAQWLKRSPECCLWGNGAGFDTPLLRAAFRAADVRWPVMFWNDMCYRTMKRLFPVDFEVLRPRGFVEHHALWDARYQALCLAEMFRNIYND